MIYHTLIKLFINQSDYNIITYLCNNRKMNSYNVKYKSSVYGWYSRKAYRRRCYAWLALNTEFYSLKYDNTQRKPNRADKQGYSVLHGEEAQAEFDCSPDSLGEINSDGFCRKEQQR